MCQHNTWSHSSVKKLYGLNLKSLKNDATFQLSTPKSARPTPFGSQLMVKIKCPLYVRVDSSRLSLRSPVSLFPSKHNLFLNKLSLSSNSLRHRGAGSAWETWPPLSSQRWAGGEGRDRRPCTGRPSGKHIHVTGSGRWTLLAG